MPRAWQMDLGDGVGHRPGAHALSPVGVVAVCDLKGDRTPQREAVTDAPGDLGGIALDLHPPTAAVAELTTRHVLVEIPLTHLKARGQTLENACEAGTVRLAGGCETERHLPSLFARNSAPVAPASERDAGASDGCRAAGEYEHTPLRRVGQAGQCRESLTTEHFPPGLGFGVKDG